MKEARAWRRLIVASIFLAGFVVPAEPALSAGHDALSPRLAKLAASPQLRSGSRARVADALDLPRTGGGSIQRRGARVVAEVRFAAGSPLELDALRVAGARVVAVNRSLATVTVAAAPARLRAIARVPGVAGVTEVLAPILGAAGDTGPQTAAAGCGSVTSEGDSQLRADSLRAGLGIDGRGHEVGVLSDSYNRNVVASQRAPDDVASGDLPGPGNPCGRTAPVQVVDDSFGTGSDEGRAMLQIVHDLAPGARLAFAQAASSQAAMVDNIGRLRNAGADVLVDNATFLDEPFFQDGPIANAVNRAAARGVAYFSIAANNNQRHSGRNIASWESPSFRPTSSCPAGVAPPCEDFNPTAATDSTFRFRLPAGRTAMVDVQWAQPWFGVTTDLNAYLRLPGAPAPIAKSENANVTKTQKPVEVVSWTNATGAAQDVELVVNRSGAGDSRTPRLKVAFVQNGQAVTSTEYETSTADDVVGPNIFGHNGTAGAIMVAAVPSFNPGVVEPFSSRGPVTHYFGPVDGTKPAPRLPRRRTLNKPDVSASDCVHNTFFGASAGNVFCGTSAAAPHAAAIAALQRQADATLTPGQIRALQRASGRPVGGFTAPAIGGGLIDAVAAAPRPRVTIRGRSFTRDTTPTFTFFANRAASFRCSLDRAAPAPCSSPSTLRVTREGRHTFAVTATDALGHQGVTTRRFALDFHGPRTIFDAGPRRFTHIRRPRFRFHASEAGATFVCRLGARRFRRCPGRFRPPSRLRDGRYRLQVIATDRAGNAGPRRSRRFTVDTKRPRVRIRRHPGRLTVSHRARFRFASSERRSTFRCKLDRRRYRRCARRSRFRVRGGSHRLRVRAVDRAGNRSRAKTFRWRVAG